MLEKFMGLTRYEFKNDKLTLHAGYSDFLLVSPDRKHNLEFSYAGEPPHGDSYHVLKIDGRPFPGLAWGCNFAMSKCFRYVAFSWMSKESERITYERLTVVVDLDLKRYFVLPQYIHDMKIEWPNVIGQGKLSTGKTCTFTGHEPWLTF